MNSELASMDEMKWYELDKTLELDNFLGVLCVVRDYGPIVSIKSVHV